MTTSIYCRYDYCIVSEICLCFLGKYFWRLTRNKHLVSLQPAQIHRFWKGLPLNMDSIDAIYERTTDHKIVFFKGKYNNICLIALMPNAVLVIFFLDKAAEYRRKTKRKCNSNTTVCAEKTSLTFPILHVNL